jgi:hypothetical protein
VYSSTVSLTSVLDVGLWLTSSSGALSLERSGAHCIGGWVGPRAALNACGKSRFCEDLIPGRVQPIASRYTDCCIVLDHYNETSNFVLSEKCRKYSRRCVLVSLLTAQHDTKLVVSILVSRHASVSAWCYTQTVVVLNVTRVTVQWHGD